MIRVKTGIEKWKQGNLQEAEVCFRQYLSDFPSDVNVIANLANVYRDRGDLKNANKWYLRALKLEPNTTWIHSNRLMTLNYDPEVDSETILQAHLKWGKQLSLPDPVSFKNERTPGKRIHIGFVSGDFRWHSVAFFLFGLLKEFNSDQVEVTCFSENRSSDEMTALIRAHSDGWVDTSGMSDDQFLKTTRRSRLDVLIDLSGHTAYNRMEALARRCAPLQVSWLGYPTITGNPCIDYWMTDSAILGDSSDQLGQVSALVMKEGIHSYFPPVQEYDLPITDHKKKPAGKVVLGCFNHRAKISAICLKNWAQILKCEPNTELLLKNRSFNDPQEVANLRYEMEKLGVNGLRITTLRRTPTCMEHLRTYEKIDIALDTFPYNGTTTTCEAIWMGIPVVTCVGDTHASRVGASLLTQLGAPEWIAEDMDGYCRIVGELVRDNDLRVNFSKTARARMRTSGLSDCAKFARAFEEQVRSIWMNYCFSGQ